MTVSRIERVLAADDANSKISPKLIAQLHPAAAAHFELTDDMFRLLLEKVDSRQDAEDSTLAAMASEMGLTEDALVVRLSTRDVMVPEDAREAFQRLRALRVVRLLVLAVERYWVFGATDFHRLRVASAGGYLRLEAEASAFVTLFLRNPALAIRWQSLGTRDEGKRFFRETQGDVLKVLEAVNLRSTYDISSGGSQHVRMASLVRSMPDSGESRLRGQEFDVDDPYSFHLALAYFHRTQSRVLFALGQALSLGEDREWNAAMLKFEEQTNVIWNALEARYRGEIAAGRE